MIPRRLEEAIQDSGQLNRDKRAELGGVISTRSGLSRYLRVTADDLFLPALVLRAHKEHEDS